MKSRHAREIGPFRSSGVNPRPVPPQAPQASDDDWAPPNGHMVSLGTRSASPRMQAHAASLANVTMGDPPRVAAGTATVGVFLDGARVTVPADWHVAYASANGRDMLFALTPGNELHVLRLDQDGRLREFHGLSGDLVADIVRWRFPRGRR